jgi:hypothetical protein
MKGLNTRHQRETNLVGKMTKRKARVTTRRRKPRGVEVPKKERKPSAWLKSQDAEITALREEAKARIEQSESDQHHADMTDHTLDQIRRRGRKADQKYALENVKAIGSQKAQDVELGVYGPRNQKGLSRDFDATRTHVAKDESTEKKDRRENPKTRKLEKPLEGDHYDTDESFEFALTRADVEDGKENYILQGEAERESGMSGDLPRLEDDRSFDKETLLAEQLDMSPFETETVTTEEGFERQKHSQEVVRELFKSGFENITAEDLFPHLFLKDDPESKKLQREAQYKLDHLNDFYEYGIVNYASESLREKYPDVHTVGDAAQHALKAVYEVYAKHHNDLVHNIDINSNDEENDWGYYFSPEDELLKYVRTWMMASYASEYKQAVPRDKKHKDYRSTQMLKDGMTKSLSTLSLDFFDRIDAEDIPWFKHYAEEVLAVKHDYRKMINTVQDMKDMMPSDLHDAEQVQKAA